MQLRQLQYFETLYRLRSFVQAAQEHAVTQSALSRGLKKLETELGQRLFDRTTHAVEPTETAAGLIQRARDVIDAMLAFEEEAERLRAGATGQGGGRGPDITRRSVVHQGRERDAGRTVPVLLLHR